MPASTGTYARNDQIQLSWFLKAESKTYCDGGIKNISGVSRVVKF